MARAFCGAIQAAGYQTANYANQDYLRRYFDADVQKEFLLWLAQWPKSNAIEPWAVDYYLYKERHLVECFFQKGMKNKPCKRISSEKSG